MRLSLLACLALGLAGCGGGGGPTGTVSGKVTVDGEPLETGFIQFTPKDGSGKIVAGAVAGGKYYVRDVPVGVCVANVSTTSSAMASAGPISTADLAQEAAQRKAAPKRDKPVAPIPTNAQGNNVEVTVTADGANLDLAIAVPGKKK